MRAIALAAVLAPAVVAAAPAEPTIRAVVDAALTADLSRLTGTVELHVTNDTAVPLSALPFWLYPNRFAEPGPGITDRTVNWIYPAGARAGRMAVSPPRWNGALLDRARVSLGPLPAPGSPDGAPRVLGRVRLPAPLAPGERGVLVFGFEVEIPERRGRFGRWRGTAALGNGWFPRPLTDLTATRTDLPPARIAADFRIALPPGHGAVLLDRVFPARDAAQRVEARGLVGEAFPLVVMDRMTVTEVEREWGTTIYVSREVRRRRTAWKDTRGEESAFPRGLPRVGLLDIPDRGLTVVEQTAALLREDVPGCRLPARLVLVEIPAWDRLVQTGPGNLLVSDRLWRLIPFEEVLSFHDLVLARAVGAELALATVAESADVEYRQVVAELVGAYLGQRYGQQILGGVESVRDLIGFAAFMPRIDALLYAPQIPFREAYTPSIEEPDELRDEAWRFMNRLPRGRRIHAKLQDLLGPEETAALVRDLIGGVRLRAAIGARLGAQEAERFLDTWFGDYPSVNYRLGAQRDEQLPDGRYRHAVELWRDGAPVVEPVTVRLVDDDDAHADVTWDGRSDHGTVEWVSGAPLASVEIDPEHRLVEDPDLQGDHPLADNLDPLPWRPPLLTRVVLWGDAVTAEPHLQVSLALRRRYDVTNSFHLGGSLTPRGYGGSFAYLRHLGPKRTLNDRFWYVGPTIAVTRTNAVEEAAIEIPAAMLTGATMGSLGLLLGRDDREYFWDPRTGSAFSVSAAYSGGRDDGGEAVHVGSAGARAFGLWSPTFGHTFAVYGGVLGLVGEPVAADLASLSDRQVLRGFALDETYGRVGLYAVAEYRHSLIDASPISLLFFTRLDRLQGALFVAGGTMSWPGGYGGLFTNARLFTEVGYGLRLHMLSFGVAQYMIALDLAWPITPADRSYEVLQADGTIEEASRPPFRLVFGITQTY